MLILLGYMGYMLYANPAIAPTEEDSSQVDLLDEVGVVEREGKRFFVDQKDGFEIEIENLKVTDRGKFLHFSEGKISMIPSGFSIAVLENNDELSLENWLENYNKEVTLLFFEEKEKFELGSVSGYKIKHEGDPDHYIYYINGVDKVYLVSTPYPEDYEGVVSTFKLLNTDYASSNQLSN